MGDGTGTLLVPKGPRVEAQRTVEQMRDDLFRLPLPPPPTNTRTYPVHTPLGRIMRLRGLTVNDVARVEGGPNARQLTDLLSGARVLTAEWKHALGVGLGIDARLL